MIDAKLEHSFGNVARSFSALCKDAVSAECAESARAIRQTAAE